MKLFAWFLHVFLLSYQLAKGEELQLMNVQGVEDMVYKTKNQEFPKKSVKELMEYNGKHNQRHNSKFSDNKDGWFSGWSQWSECSESDCTRIRRRKCLVRSKCGDTIQSEEKSCRFIRRKERKRAKCGRRRWKERNKTKDELLFTHHQSGDKRNYTVQVVLSPQDPQTRRIISTRPTKWYSNWSQWSACNSRCFTYRKKWCRKPIYCSQQVIKESAYCYVEGTECQKLIQNKVQNDKITNLQIFLDKSYDEFPKKNVNDVLDSHSSHRTIVQPKCGVQYGGRLNSTRRSLYSMLRITGGRPSPKGKWPWQVVILNRYKEPICGGTLISPGWVITAAHCIRRRLYVRLGEHNLAVKEGTETEIRITQTIIHTEYDSETVDNDVALIRLPEYAKYVPHVAIACLPKPRQTLPVSKMCTIIGWGKRRTTDAHGTHTLHEAQVPIVTSDVCRNTYIDYYITPNMFCAGHRRGRIDTCAGDSGGPILCQDTWRQHQPWTIFGITSFGDGCGKRGKYGIYTTLPNYVNWIYKVIKKHDPKDFLWLTK